MINARPKNSGQVDIRERIIEFSSQVQL